MGNVCYSFFKISFGCAGSALLCRFSLVVERRGCSLVAAQELLLVALLLWPTGSVAAAPGL